MPYMLTTLFVLYFHFIFFNYVWAAVCSPCLDLTVEWYFVLLALRNANSNTGFCGDEAQRLKINPVHLVPSCCLITLIWADYITFKSHSSSAVAVNLCNPPCFICYEVAWEQSSFNINKLFNLLCKSIHSGFCTQSSQGCWLPGHLFEHFKLRFKLL